jgi:hypothetical protein
LTSPACVDPQAAFQAEVKKYLNSKIVPVLSLEQLAVKSFSKEDAAAAIKWAETSGRWKLSWGGWMRELDLSAEESHHLVEDARNIWNWFRKTAQSKLKKQQEHELHKRTAEGQPGGVPAAKRGKQTR